MPILIEVQTRHDEGSGWRHWHWGWNKVDGGEANLGAFLVGLDKRLDVRNARAEGPEGGSKISNFKTR